MGKRLTLSGNTLERLSSLTALLGHLGGSLSGPEQGWDSLALLPCADRRTLISVLRRAALSGDESMAFGFGRFQQGCSRSSALEWGGGGREPISGHCVSQFPFRLDNQMEPGSTGRRLLEGALLSTPRLSPDYVPQCSRKASQAVETPGRHLKILVSALSAGP